ncbi:MAG: hypothetical protein ACK4PR_13260 [Gammaproteobacteria bacterium]
MKQEIINEINNLFTDYKSQYNKISAYCLNGEIKKEDIFQGAWLKLNPDAID